MTTHIDCPCPQCRAIEHSETRGSPEGEDRTIAGAVLGVPVVGMLLIGLWVADMLRACYRRCMCILRWH